MHKTNIDVNIIKTLVKPISKKTNITDNSSLCSKIKLYDFFVKQEIEIANYVKKITNYPFFYEIVEKYQLLNIGKLNKNTIETLGIILNTKNEYLLIEYGKNKYIDFSDFWFYIPTPTLFVFEILNSYLHLLEAITYLNKSICFFDLSPQNIYFTKNNVPLLKNFQNSILDTISSKKEIFIKILGNIESFTHKPIEIHLLFYLIANNESSLSTSLIEIISSTFCQNNLFFLTKEERENYQKEYIDFLSIYKDKPIDFIIDEVIQFYHTWDNYSLSIIYIHILGNTIKAFSLEETILNQLLESLFKNIHPNPRKREKIEITQFFHIIHNKFNNWDFIKNVSQEKMVHLYKLL